MMIRSEVKSDALVELKRTLFPSPLGKMDGSPRVIRAVPVAVPWCRPRESAMVVAPAPSFRGQCAAMPADFEI